MRLTDKSKLLKIREKNIGNRSLCREIDRLLRDLQEFDPMTSKLEDVRKDADCVHSDGFYFFNIHVHRLLVLIDFDD